MTIPTPTTDPNRQVTPAQAADLLGLQPSTLAVWRTGRNNPGLPFTKIGRNVRYRYGDLLEFISKGRRSNTLGAPVPADAG